MINLKNFAHYQETFGYLAQQLDFPEKITLNHEVFEAVIYKQHPAYKYMQLYREKLHDFTLLEIKELYSNTFDFNKDAPLYMTYNKFDTQKERGQLLAKLKVLYEMFGLKMADNELSDFLPLMLEFLHVAQWRDDPRAIENINFVIMIIEDGSFAIAEQLAPKQNPYYYLIKALRETLKACIEIEQSNEVAQNA